MASATRRNLAGVVVVVVAVLAVAELGTRAIDANLPQPLAWHNFETQKKVGQMNRLRAAGGADVVFLGNSMMNVGVDPAVVDDAVPGIHAYNASIGSAVPRQTEPWALDVVLPRLHPKLAVIGVTSFEFTDTGLGRTAFLDAFLASRGAKQAMGRESTTDRVDRWLRARSAFWDHRFELRKPRVVIDAIRGRKPAETREVATISPLGYEGYLNTQRFENRVLGAGLDVSKWAPGTRDVGALDRLVRGLQARHVVVALVSMPVTAEYIAGHPHGMADFDRFSEMLRGLAQRDGAALIELDLGRQHQYFADEVHLRRTGNEEFTRQLLGELRARNLLPAP